MQLTGGRRSECERVPLTAVMPGVADHAYNHCLAVLGDTEAATEAAAIAVRHGGRPRWAVLGHARHEALLRPPALPEGEPAGHASLVEVARWLAAPRPPEERALLDLADRHELDRAALGRAWGTSPAEVADQLSAVDETWTRELDPALLLWLGPGECGELATILPPERDAAGTVPSAPLQSLAPHVRAHVDDCEACGDRMRAMVSVRTLLATAPFEHAPQEVRATGRRRRRRPVPVPAATARRPRRRFWTIGGAAATIVAIVVAVVALAVMGDRDDGRLEALTVVPAGGGALVVEPDHMLDHDSPPLSLRNTSTRKLSWTARTKDFLVLVPASGELAPGARARVRVALAPNAPEGTLRTAVTFSADDGSTVALQFESVVERAPDIDASARACAVTAAVEDEAELAAVLLHWRAGVEEFSVGMDERDDEVFAGVLPSAGGPLTWWVSATDGRGNSADTPPQDLAPSCG